MGPEELPRLLSWGASRAPALPQNLHPQAGEKTREGKDIIPKAGAGPAMLPPPAPRLLRHVKHKGFPQM